MKKSLETFRRIKGYTDPAASGRDWNLTTAMVMQGKAGFQFMGDWAKGEFLAAGKVPGKDFLCAAAPGTANAFTFNIDSFAMFKLKSADGPEGAERPGRGHHEPGVPGDLQPEQGLDPGAPEHGHGQVRRLRQASAKDFVDTAKSGGLVPSIAHSMAVSPATEGAIKDAVSQFWNDDKITVADAMEAKFWVGQRRLRIQDIHILDNFLLNYGDNEGAGFTDLPVGSVKLGVGVFTGDKFDSQLPANVKANRVNFDISDIQTNPGGKLRVLLTAMTGTGLVAGNNGSGISLMHQQADFFGAGINNTLYLQTSRGHARIDGQFEAIDGVNAGKRVTRIADAVNWQLRPLRRPGPGGLSDQQGRPDGREHQGLLAGRARLLRLQQELQDADRVVDHHPQGRGRRPAPEQAHGGCGAGAGGGLLVAS
jgi:hypothetical protein